MASAELFLTLAVTPLLPAHFSLTCTHTLAATLNWACNYSVRNNRPPHALQSRAITSLQIGVCAAQRKSVNWCHVHERSACQVRMRQNSLASSPQRWMLASVRHWINQNTSCWWDRIPSVLDNEPLDLFFRDSGYTQTAPGRDAEHHRGSKCSQDLLWLVEHCEEEFQNRYRKDRGSRSHYNGKEDEEARGMA